MGTYNNHQHRRVRCPVGVPQGLGLPGLLPPGPMRSVPGHNAVEAADKLRIRLLDASLPGAADTAT